MNQFGIVKPTPPAIVLEHPDDGSHTEMTAVVTGLPFGGTSMVAAVVDALGLPFVTSDEFWYAWEASKFNNVDWASLCESVKQQDTLFQRWGYKDPHAHRFDPAELNALFRNPHYIFVTKGLASMVARVVQNPDVDDGTPAIARFQTEADLHIKYMRWMLDFPTAPKLLVSYYAAVRAPAEFCRIVAKFLHLAPTAEQFIRATSRVSPNGGYLVKEDVESNHAYWTIMTGRGIENV